MCRPFDRAARAVAVLLGLVLLWPAVAAAQQKQFGGSEMTRKNELLRKVLPSVVSITTRKDVVQPDSGTNAAGATTGPVGAFGSGFIVDPSGILATNFHVVKDAWAITVTFNDGTQVPAHLLRATRLIDVALLKVDVDHPLPAVTWGDSTKLQVGEPVLAIGNALDVGISVSGGLVSALNRKMGSLHDLFETARCRVVAWSKTSIPREPMICDYR